MLRTEYQLRFSCATHGRGICMAILQRSTGLPGKPGNVREFGTCQGNVRDVVNSQGIVRGKNLVMEKCPKTVHY